MRKWIYFAAGGALGAAASVVVNYLFAPAPETRFDETYQSRLDWALEAGENAADAREAALRAQFEAAKQPRPRAPDLPPEVPPNFESAAPGDFDPRSSAVNAPADAGEGASAQPSQDVPPSDATSGTRPSDSRRFRLRRRR